MKSLGEYIDELRDLDLENVGSWPAWAYGMAIALVSLVVLIIAGWYFVLPKRNTLATETHQEAQLKSTFKTRHAMVANLGAYRKQLAELKAEFDQQLAQLPSKAEVPSLLRDVSRTRAENGLHEKLFKPLPEITNDFYAELPNSLIVTGDYQQFAKFVSDVTALPRIVTISDIQIKAAPGASVSDSGTKQLQMSLTASTYRYLAKDDTAPSTKKSGS